jgi:L-ascorbate metabolism protein UlaG (beta-lactamase superfamily)
MGPQDAARACQLMGVSQAVPVHYAHNAQVLGPQAGEDFRRAVSAIAPNVKVHVMKPGDSIQIRA